MNAEKYRVSKYNLYFADDSGHNFIWNSASNVLKCVKERDYIQLSSGNYYDMSNEKKKEHLKSGFLVHACVDETQEVLRRINYHANYAMPHYRILTTTGCNAACDYCYAKGIPMQNMTCDTATAVADFIGRRAGETVSVLEWFGGEPLMNADVINIICERLRSHNLKYKSVMESNGILFDDDMISNATELWNLKRVQITLDGVGRQHEAVKKLDEGTFDKIIQNIHGLLGAGIKVNIRIIHVGDMERESEVIYFLDREFPAAERRPAVYISPLYKAGKSYSPSYVKQILILNKILLETNFVREEQLYDLSKYSGLCFASTISGYTIAPDGIFYNCSHNMSPSQRTGSIWSREEHNEIRKKFVFRKLSDECRNCVLFPICQGGCRVAEMKLAPMTQCHIWKNVIKDILKIKLNLQDSLI